MKHKPGQPKNIEEVYNKKELQAFWDGVAEGRKHHAFTKEQCDTFTNALSDFLCWIEGFQCGGGKYTPQSIEPLRDLNIKLKAMHGGSSSSQSHF